MGPSLEGMGRWINGETPAVVCTINQHPMTQIQHQIQFVDILELRLAKKHCHGFMAAEQGVGVGVGVDLFEVAEQARGWVGRMGGQRQWLTQLGDPQTSVLLVCAAEVQV